MKSKRFRCQLCHDKGEIRVGAGHKAHADACPSCAERARQEWLRYGHTRLVRGNILAGAMPVSIGGNHGRHP